MRIAPAQRAEIHRHHVRQQRGTNRAVRRGKTAANWPGETMHRAQPGVGQSQSAEQTRHRHVFPRVLVLPLAERHAQRPRRTAKPLDA